MDSEETIKLKIELFENLTNGKGAVTFTKEYVIESVLGGFDPTELIRQKQEERNKKIDTLLNE